ncbi:peptidoglycan-binding domain-containing protein [Streptomyces macrosporus]|uniref:Peptidoglycan binding-like domain-containing protein n=1 Tax=Streptomyces macrosporus TaxID=44032 RepID=A0ABN3K2L6_9ACTN
MDVATGPDPASSFRPPVARTGFLTGRRGPRTGVLLLTTGAIGSTLAALLLASGVLTPPDPRRPTGLAVPSPNVSPPPSPRGAVPSPSASDRPLRTSAPATTRAAPTPPVSAPSPEPSRSGASGVLRPGDSGPAVSALQRRLRKVPHIYPDGAVTGRYDDELARAVARFQEWYGVHGDEEGVYGDDTRRRLEEVS